MSSPLPPLHVSPGSSVPVGPPARRHDVDALRALAFALVILYHLGMYYVAGWPWHLKSPHASEWLQWPLRLLNRWRMDLVFLVSGVSLALLARGRPAMALLRSRVVRLLLPLAFGMVAVVPYQAYAQGVTNGYVAPGFGAFLLRYLLPGGERWPAAAFDGAEFGITWNHLWFLPYLLVYTVLVLLFLPLWRAARAGRWRKVAGRWLVWRLPSPRVRGACVLLLPLLPLLAWALWLAPRFVPTHDLLHDGYLHARYATVFVLGCLLGGWPPWWQGLVTLRWVALLAALVAACAVVALRQGALPSPWLLPWAGALARTVYGWSMLVAVLGFGHLHLNRPWPWLGWSREAVYPWYVLHQSLLVVAIVWITPAGLGPVPEALVLLLATVLGCWWLTDSLVRRVGWLRPLFGLPPARGGCSPAATPRRISLRGPRTWSWRR